MVNTCLPLNFNALYFPFSHLNPAWQPSIHFVGDGHQRMWPLVDPWAGPEQSEAPPSTPVFEMYGPCTVPALGTISGTPWAEYMTEPSLSLYINFEDSGSQVQRSTGLAAPNTSLICKFLCLLKLPSTNLKWSASSFGLSLPSVYRGQFWISPREPLEFWTNTSSRHGKFTLVSGLVLSLLFDCFSLFLIIQVSTQESLPQRGLLRLSCHTALNYSFLAFRALTYLILLSLFIFLSPVLWKVHEVRDSMLFMAAQSNAQHRVAVQWASAAWLMEPSPRLASRVFLQQLGPCWAPGEGAMAQDIVTQDNVRFPDCAGGDLQYTGVLPETLEDIKGRQGPFWCREPVPYSKETDLVHLSSSPYLAHWKVLPTPHPRASQKERNTEQIRWLFEGMMVDRRA